MRTILFVLALALGACASPQDPGTILDWAPVRPPPVPGVGLPKPRAPTFTPAAKPQPQPQPQRLLPQTPETARQPGIWASDDPETRDGGVPRLLNVDLPRIPHLRSDELFEHAIIASGCVSTIAERLKFLSLMDQSMALLPEPRACLAARLYDLCLRRKVDAEVKSRAGSDSVLSRALTRSAKDAAEFRDKMCSNTPLPDVERIAGAVERTWDIIVTKGGSKR